MEYQKIIDFMFDNIDCNNKNEGYKSLLEYYISLSSEQREEVDLSRVYESLLLTLDDFEVELEIIYGFARYDSSFKQEVDEEIESCGQTALICQYIELNDKNDEDFVSLCISAISVVMPENQNEIEALAKLREKCIQRGLYDRVYEAIKLSGNVETVIYASLCFDSKLIDEVFGGKKEMFLYLSAVNFDNEECIDRLLALDSNQLQKSMKETVKSIDKKILNKKI